MTARVQSLITFLEFFLNSLWRPRAAFEVEIPKSYCNGQIDDVDFDFDIFAKIVWPFKRQEFNSFYKPFENRVVSFHFYTV